VIDQFIKPLFVQELPAGVDPRIVMIEALSRSVREGFEVEELPGNIPLYFCKKENERGQVSIVRELPTAIRARK
jgi:hypothetical protein